MLKLINVEVMYSGIMLIIKGISLEVGEGKIVAILGSNGAGKTTTLKSISGLIQIEEGDVSDGKILYNDRLITNENASNLVKMGIIQVVEGRKVLIHLSVEQNLMIGAHLEKNSKKTKDNLDLIYSTYFPALKNLKQNTAGYLSGGEQQMLVLGRAMMASPKLMLLDEPSLGLAPLVVKDIFGVIEQVNKRESIAFLIVEQNVGIALSLAEYGYVMEMGRIVYHATSEKLMKNEDIAEFYLGINPDGKRKSYRDAKYYKRRKRWLG